MKNGAYIFIGAYWGQRAEARESAAQRIVSFLEAVSSCGLRNFSWYEKSYSRARALQKTIGLEPNAVSRSLRQPRDMERAAIRELGFSFSAWNGDDMSFSAAIGCWSARVSNVAVLTIDRHRAYPAKFFRCVVEQAVLAFDPGHAVVTTPDRMLQACGDTRSVDGVFTYAKGEGFRHDPKVAQSLGMDSGSGDEW